MNDLLLFTVVALLLYDNDLLLFTFNALLLHDDWVGDDLLLLFFLWLWSDDLLWRIDGFWLWTLGWQNWNFLIVCRAFIVNLDAAVASSR